MVETLIGIVAIGAMTLLGVPIAHLRRNVGNLPRPKDDVTKITREV